MPIQELIDALRRMQVETGSLACLGCGWEHDCGAQGCAILRGVKAELEEETARTEEAMAANHQLDGVVTNLMDSNRKLADAVKSAEARAEEAEAALAAAVGDMEAMALTIRRRTDYDTECCPFCRYDGPTEDYCLGWEEDEEEPCFRWRGADRSRKPTGDLSRDATKMVPLTLEQLRRRVEKAGRPVVVFVVTIDPDTGERDFDGDWEMFDGDDFVADGTWDTCANYGVTFEAYTVQPKPSTDRSAPGR